MTRLDSVERALADIAAGKAVVVVDDEDRENEGDLIFAAEMATPELVAFMVRYTSGYLCVPLDGDICDRLGLLPMYAVNQDKHGTAYTVTVDAKDGVGTGISASDRATTMRALANPGAVAQDFTKPGHVVPLRAKDGGVLRRPGHTEAAVDLARLAGLQPAGAICEIVSQKDEGSMAQTDELRVFADDHDLALISIADLMQSSESGRAEHARAIRSRVKELHERLGIRFPIYVLLTKSDLIAGFTEFFDDLGKDERGQVWGMTFPLDETGNGEPPLARFATEFAALEQRLSVRVAERLQTERDPARRDLVYGFPQQFAALRECLGEFLNGVFKPNPYEERPLLRGLYFTSGTQEGSPIDRLIGSMAQSMNLDRQHLARQTGTGRSYFIERLFREVAFGERGLVGTNPKVERRRKWLTIGALSATALVVLAVTAVWIASYRANQSYIAAVDQRVDPLARGIESLSPAQRDVLAVLPQLNAVQNLAGDAPSWAEGYGLYQGDMLGEESASVYRKLLIAVFAPRLVTRIEEQLRSGGSSDFLYEGLKAYLMLGSPDHYDADFIKAWMKAQPTGAPGRRGWLVACQPWWELVCPVIAAIAAASGDSCVSAGVDGLVVCGVMPRTLAQTGCKLGLLTVSSISSATLDAGWRGRIGLGAGLGDAPARPLPAVAEMGDVDALGAVGRGDAAQLIRQALGRARPTAAVGDTVGVQQVIELTGGALPVQGQDAICKVLVQCLGDGVAFQGPVDASAHELGVLLLEFTRCKAQGAGHCLAQPFVIGHALLLGQFDRRQNRQRSREQIE